MPSPFSGLFCYGYWSSPWFISSARLTNLPLLYRFHMQSGLLSQGTWIWWYGCWIDKSPFFTFSYARKLQDRWQIICRRSLCVFIWFSPLWQMRSCCKAFSRLRRCKRQPWSSRFFPWSIWFWCMTLCCCLSASQSCCTYHSWKSPCKRHNRLHH